MSNARILKRIYEKLLSEFGKQGWWPGESKFEIAVGAILTQNTNWKNVEKAINNLKSAGLLNPRDLRDIDIRKLAELIRPSGYYKIKAKRLKNFIDFLWREYGGDIEAMLTEKLDTLRPKLLSVSGVGRETADSILLYAGGYPVFVVDTYTFRIFARHGLVPDDIDYESLREFFESNLPDDPALYNEYHALLVRLGKEICRPRPLCEKCPLLDLLGKPVWGVEE